MQIKQLVECLYPGHEVIVTGSRPPPRGGKRYPYRACVIINGKTTFAAEERNWRMAYKSLQIDISRGLIS